MFYVKSLLLYTSHSSAHLLNTVGGLYIHSEMLFLNIYLFSKEMFVPSAAVC